MLLLACNSSTRLLANADASRWLKACLLVGVGASKIWELKVIYFFQENASLVLGKAVARRLFRADIKKGRLS